MSTVAMLSAKAVPCSESIPSFKIVLACSPLVVWTPSRAFRVNSDYFAKSSAEEECRMLVLTMVLRILDFNLQKVFWFAIDIVKGLGFGLPVERPRADGVSHEK